VKRTVPFGAALLLLVACRTDKDAAGPAERAGKGVDRAAEKTGAAFHRAAVKTDEAAHKAVRATGEVFEKAGKKLKSAPRATQKPTAPKPAE